MWAVYKGLGQKEISLSLEGAGEAGMHRFLSACKKLQEQIDELNGERERIQSCLAEVSEKLGLPQTVTPSAVLEYYRAVSDIQEAYCQIGSGKISLCRNKPSSWLSRLSR